MVRVAAIVLAAGSSARFGGENKLLADVGGKPLIWHTLKAVCAMQCAPIFVVTGHMADEIERGVQCLPVTAIRNDEFDTGMGNSIAAGVGALPQDVDAAFICLGDMPLISTEVFELLSSGFHERGDTEAICVPVHQGQRGHPVLFGRSHFPGLAALKGDAGARHILKTCQHNILEVEVADDTIVRDCDTQEALELLRSRFS